MSGSAKCSNTKQCTAVLKKLLRYFIIKKILILKTIANILKVPIPMCDDIWTLRTVSFYSLFIETYISEIKLCVYHYYYFFCGGGGGGDLATDYFFTWPWLLVSHHQG